MYVLRSYLVILSETCCINLWKNCFIVRNGWFKWSWRWQTSHV